MNKWQRIMYQPGVGIGPGGSRVTACEDHRNLSKEAAKEGMVLLKNEGAILPLREGSRMALFGKASFDYVKGGGGSGDVTVEYITNLYQGFEKMGLAGNVHQETADFYRKWVERQYQAGIEPGMTKEPVLPRELAAEARSFADTALISICRFSGEGWDRKSKYDERMDEHAVVIAGNTKDPSLATKETFPEGDFYLTAEEKAMVEVVTEYFDRVVLVLNVGGMVDTSWFIHDQGIGGVLLAWQGGMEGGLAAAELLMGQGNPSGKLPDTFAARLEDYPSSYNFHESDFYVNYTDDIYVGYRYFETVPGAAGKVNYPFGYGLSYTKFSWQVLEVTECFGKIQVRINLTNTRKIPGKEVLQLYGQAPQGKLGKPRKHLLCYEKSRLLQGGESQIITLKFKMEDMASYDDLGKVFRSAYVLEAGDYFFHLGNSVEDTEKLDYVYKLSEDTLVQQLEPKLVPASLPERMLADGSMEKMPQLPERNPRECGLPFQSKEPLDGLKPGTRQVDGTYCWGQDLYKKGVRPFIEVAKGQMSLEDFVAQMTEE
ncbi:MAG: glycoside hydrolase family 3 C-terminal domain-containing protein, partial [Eubacterium sp.]|nr:glycoside hydrolase family 3 C-terminal domain-containing protein [Eubacterium sp.]